MTFEILPERPIDAALIEALLDRTFGFNRERRTVYRLREGVVPVAALSFCAVEADGSLLGSIRFWPIAVASGPALLLGPLAVEPALQGQGVGRALVRHGLAQATRDGWGLCLVVGDPDYYRSFGFIQAAQAGIILPGPVEPERFQAAALRTGALDNAGGIVGRAVTNALGMGGAARRA